MQRANLRCHCHGVRPCPGPHRKRLQGSSCNSNQSLKSCDLGLSAWVMACEEDINHAALNKNDGKREGERAEDSFSESLHSPSFCPQRSNFPFKVALTHNGRVTNITSIYLVLRCLSTPSAAACESHTGHFSR